MSFFKKKEVKGMEPIFEKKKQPVSDRLLTRFFTLTFS